LRELECEFSAGVPLKWSPYNGTRDRSPALKTYMLYLISWLTDFSAFLFLFGGHRHLAEQQASQLVLGVLGSTFFLAASISNAIGGNLADRFGRRRISLCGAVLFTAVAGIVAITGPSGWFFYVAYTLVGVALGIIYPPLIAWLSVRHRGRASSRAFLFFCLSFNFGMLTAQLCGGWMYQHVSPLAPMIVALVGAFAALICIALLPREVEQTKSADPPKPNEPVADSDLANSFARLAWLANFGGMFSMSTVWFLYPSLAVALQVPAEAHGVTLAVGRGVVMSIYCVMYFQPNWQFRFRYSLLAQITGIIGLLGLCSAQTTIGLTASIAGLSTLLGFNYFASLFYNAQGADKNRKGRAFGLNEAFLALGAAGGSLFGGLAAPYLGIRGPYQMAMIVVAIMATVQCGLRFRRLRVTKVKPPIRLDS